MPEEDNLEVIRRLTERWNAGDMDGYLELHHDDAVMLTTPEWPEQGPWRGKQELRASVANWRGAWDTIAVRIDDLRGRGDKVAAQASWISRGRASGADQSLGFSMVFILREGKVEQAQFFTDHADALREAGIRP
jgi:ketosteroid isomerase-like protein